MKSLKMQKSGFTLVELLVSMAISLIFLAGIVQISRSNQNNYVEQELVSEMQQNVRSAKALMEYDLRMAGYKLQANFGNFGISTYSIVFTDGGASGSDTLSVYYIDDRCEVDSATAGTSCKNLLILTLNTATTMAAGAITANVNENTGAWSTGCYCQVNSDINTYSGAGSSFEPFQVIISSPTSTANIFQSDVMWISKAADILINSVKIDTDNNSSNGNGVGVVFAHPPAGSPANPLPTITFLRDNSFKRKTYGLTTDRFLRCGDVTTVNTSTPAVAENIYDLQCSFGLDTSATPDAIIDSWVNTGLTNPQVSQVCAIKVSILGRTETEHPERGLSSPPVTQLENHILDTSMNNKGYRWVLSQFIVQTRNLAPSLVSP